MRNAKKSDILFIREGGEMPYNVMFYQSIVGKKVHRKKLYNNCALMYPEAHVIVESADGEEVCICNPFTGLSHIEEKPNNQKTKKRYTRPSGTGYTAIVPYDSSLIKVGTKVVLRNGDKETVVEIDNRQPALVTTKTHGSMFLESGRKNNRHGFVTENDITAVYVTTKFKPAAPPCEVSIPIYFTQEEINVLDELIGWGVGGSGKKMDVANSAWKKITKKAINTSDHCPNWLEGGISIRS